MGSVYIFLSMWIYKSVNLYIAYISRYIAFVYVDTHSQDTGEKGKGKKEKSGHKPFRTIQFWNH